MSRRSFITAVGLLPAAASMLAPRGALAGPMTREEFEKLIPPEKNLSPEWVRSLFERGRPEVFTLEDGELNYIGMPIGGIACGQLYLGGDGKLWHWDIFDSPTSTDYTWPIIWGEHYLNPMQPNSPLEQGFAMRVLAGGEPIIRFLDRRSGYSQGFLKIAFRGEYPIGRVQYRDRSVPVDVDLEAFSPFVPLDVEDSALPATLMHYTITNKIGQDVEVELIGWLQNAVSLKETDTGGGQRTTEYRKEGNLATVLHTAESAGPVSGGRADIVLEDFESGSYDRWTVEGQAFGGGPSARTVGGQILPAQNRQGERLAHSHLGVRGTTDPDELTGRLVSREFRLERRYLSFLVGGGYDPQRLSVRLLVDGQIVRSATGPDEGREIGRLEDVMRRVNWDVSAFEGKAGRIEVADRSSGNRGRLSVDHIILTDTPKRLPLERLPGYGSMALSLVKPSGEIFGVMDLGHQPARDELFNRAAPLEPGEEVTHDLSQPLVGGLGERIKLAPGERKTITFVITWFFPDYRQGAGDMSKISGNPGLKRHYASRFSCAVEVARYVANNYDQLAGATRLWNQTWYDSSLPYWLLDRSFVGINCLASQTFHWFDNGRFWGWEGTNCCPGTCQHVWNYAQAMARIFPQIERSLRKDVDFGVAWRDNGFMDYRAENTPGRMATDGTCGTIIRAYREHQMSADDAFLRRIWPRIKKSIEFMIAQDADQNGILEGAQSNTLDAAWYGPMGWISSLYLAALGAGKAMANEMGDPEFATLCERIVDAGRRNIVADLFNGEYFIHRPDPNHAEAINSNDGCEIDQVMGQSLLWQVGLPPVIPQKEAVSALRALWKYNFAPDAWVYREGMQDIIPGGRPYALQGEAGLLMCTWPRGGAERAAGQGRGWFVAYFNECMNGFEYQPASHMVWEGMVEEGLAILKKVHERYGAKKRNPYNEIECSDHYSRSMASYGVLLAACGYEYHGPRGHLSFAPRLHPEDFRAPFTAAEGWGTFRQKRLEGRQSESIEVKWGTLRLRTLAFELDEGATATNVSLRKAAEGIAVEFVQHGRRVSITLRDEITIQRGESLEVTMS